MRSVYFFIAAATAFKSHAVPFSDTGAEKPINCDNETATVSASHLAPTNDPDWKFDYFHPIEVCATAKNLKNVDPCEGEAPTHVTLEVLPKGDNVTNVNFNFSISKLLATNPTADTHTYCHIFTGSEILAATKDAVLEEALFGAHAVIFGTLNVSTIASTTQVSLNTSPFYFDKPGMLNVTRGDTTHHEVVCSFRGCRVKAAGPFIRKTAERFIKAAGKAPKLVQVVDGWTSDMFAITVYECKNNRCPTAFFAEEDKKLFSAAPSGLSASLHLTIASVVATLLTSQL